MKPWHVWPLMAAVFALMWALSSAAPKCRSGEVLVRGGVLGACVVGRYN